MNDNEIHILLEAAIKSDNLLQEKKVFFNEREEYIYSIARSLSLLW